VIAYSQHHLLSGVYQGAEVVGRPDGKRVRVSETRFAQEDSRVPVFWRARKPANGTHGCHGPSYQKNLIATCPMRAGWALNTYPKVELRKSPFGSLNCAWLKALKNSPRNSSVLDSVI
jgi:hypothetical protein